MKMLVASDFHGDSVMLGVSRYEEVTKAIKQSVDAAIQEKVDTYLFIGDLTDPDTGGHVFKTIAFMVKQVRRLTACGIRFVGVAGNHDVVQDGTGATTLTPLTHLHSELVWIFDRPGTVQIGPLPENLILLALPYTAPSHAYDPSLFSRKELECLPANWRVIVAAHLMLPGIHPGSETKDMPRGRDITFPFEATKDVFMRFCGHYHKRQTFESDEGGPPIIIPGSLARLTFGEEDHEPGFLIVEV